jgi:hypothetical protein
MPYGDPAGYLPRVKRARLKQKPVRVGKLTALPPKKKGPAPFKVGLTPSAADLKKTRNVRKSY